MIAPPAGEQKKLPCLRAPCYHTGRMTRGGAGRRPGIRCGTNEEGVEKTMGKKITIATAIAFAIGCLQGPPDVASQLTLGIMAAFVCAVPLLILARVAFVRAASPPMHTLVCVLVCIISVLSIFSYLLVLKVTHDHERLQAPPTASSRQ